MNHNRCFRERFTHFNRHQSSEWLRQQNARKQQLVLTIQHPFAVDAVGSVTPIAPELLALSLLLAKRKADNCRDVPDGSATPHHTTGKLHAKALHPNFLNIRLGHWGHSNGRCDDALRRGPCGRWLEL